MDRLSQTPMDLTRLLCALLLGLILPPGVDGQETPPLVEARNDSLTVRMVDVDLRLAVQALARFLDHPVIFGELGEFRITLEAATPVPRETVPDLLRTVLATYGLELNEESGYYRVGDAVPDQTPDPVGAPDMQLFNVRLRHARAPDVAASVNALYGRGGAFGEPGAHLETLDQRLREDLVPPVEELRPDIQPPIINMVAQLSGDVTIIPDLRTNSLLIRASRRDFELIRAAVQELDVRPLQVLIEVIIAEVRRDRSLGIGTDADLPPTPVPGTENTEVSGASVGLGLGDFVMRVMNLGGADLSLVLRTAASRGEVSILSRPVLLATNNEVAEILVGSQRPFVQVQRALPTEAPVRDQVVQFKDVGTRLSVVPTVSEDGFVMLEVAQEVNAATAEVAFDAPVISTRSVRTQLLVRDGQTAVLGGLADRQKESTRSGVPLLSEIPILGAFFGRQVVRTTETELFVFLTPHVIRDESEWDDASKAVGADPSSLIGGTKASGGG